MKDAVRKSGNHPKLAYLQHTFDIVLQLDLSTLAAALLQTTENLGFQLFEYFLGLLKIVPSLREIPYALLALIIDLRLLRVIAIVVVVSGTFLSLLREWWRSVVHSLVAMNAFEKFEPRLFGWIRNGLFPGEIDKEVRDLLLFNSAAATSPRLLLSRQERGRFSAAFDGVAFVDEIVDNSRITSVTVIVVPSLLFIDAFLRFASREIRHPDADEPNLGGQNGLEKIGRRRVNDLRVVGGQWQCQRFVLNLLSSK